MTPTLALKLTVTAAETRSFQRAEIVLAQVADVAVSTETIRRVVQDVGQEFWNNPDGAEAILQVRAAALCDDHRLVHHIQTRRGGGLTRRPKPPTASRATAQKL